MTAATVVHQIADSCRRYPQRVALYTPHGAYDYAQLEATVHGLQQALRSAGLPANRLIGVLTGDHPLCYASILAILACGCAYVPINRRNPLDRNRAILDSAGVDLVIAHRAHAALDEAIATRTAGSVLRSDKASAVPGKIVLPRIDADDLAYLFYTSGSTGTPKGVPIRHRNVNAFMRVMLDPTRYTFSAEDRFLQMFELTFDPSVASFAAPLCIGASSYVIAEQGAASFNVIQVLREHAITVALMVPSVLFYLRRYFDEIRLPDLRYSLFCGEALPHGLTANWAQCAPNSVVQNLYGPTEATIVCLGYEWDAEKSAAEAENGVVPIGKPFPGMDAFIVDANGCVVEAGQRGELCLAGGQVTDRYWGDEKRTADTFFELAGCTGPVYRTGDVCFVNEQGNFVYCGRSDQQIKIDGYRVELGEVEHFASEAAAGANAAVIATTAPDGAAMLTLFLEDPPLGSNAIMAYLETKLPPHMLPKRIEALAELPLNMNGKIDRPALAARLEGV